MNLQVKAILTTTSHDDTQVRKDRRNAKRERKKMLKLLGFRNENRYVNRTFWNDNPNSHNYITYTLIIMNLQYS